MGATITTYNLTSVANHGERMDQLKSFLDTYCSELITFDSDTGTGSSRRLNYTFNNVPTRKVGFGYSGTTGSAYLVIDIFKLDGISRLISSSRTNLSYSYALIIYLIKDPTNGFFGINFRAESSPSINPTADFLTQVQGSDNEYYTLVSGSNNFLIKIAPTADIFTNYLYSGGVSLCGLYGSGLSYIFNKIIVGDIYILDEINGGYQNATYKGLKFLTKVGGSNAFIAGEQVVLDGVKYLPLESYGTSLILE